MSKTTSKDHKERINEILFQIHLDISAEHSVEYLSKSASMSPFHFNRVFKKIVGQSVHSYIRRVRLEHCANALLFNPNSTINEIFSEVGFVSNSSFTHAFKSHFGQTPSKWREVDIPLHVSDNLAKINPLHVEIDYVPKKRVVYVRHRGYNKSIKEAWQRLEEWTLQNNLEFSRLPMIGLHHSNPNIVKKEDCHYVACLELQDDNVYFRSGDIGIMEIPKMFCAKFKLEGKYGDLMKYMDYIYYKWLPNSQYEKVHLPSMALYHKNHFISKDELFELDFYVPIRYS